MREVTTTLAEAIEASERTVRVRVSVDWDGDGHGGEGTIDDVSRHVTGVALDRTMTTQVPDEVRVVEGQGAATATVDLAGGDPGTELEPASRYWSRFNTASPYYGKPRISRSANLAYEFLTSAGWEGVPRISDGLMWGLPVDAGQQSASMEIIDARDRLRAMVTLPVIIAESYGERPDEDAKRVGHPGLEASWIASYALYTAGYYLAPPPRGDTLLYLPCHGSLQPFIQWDRASSVLGYADSSGAPTTGARAGCCPGPFLLAADAMAAARRYGVTDGRVSVQAGLRVPEAPMVDADAHCTFRLEAWVRRSASVMTETFARLILWPGRSTMHSDNKRTVLIDPDGSSSVQFNDPDYGNTMYTLTVTGPTFDIDNDTWHHFGVHVDEPNGTLVWYWDGETTTQTFTPIVASVPYTMGQELTAQWYAWADTAEVHVVAGLGQGDEWLPDTWTPTAVLDRLSNRHLTGNIDTEPRQAWDLLSELVSAELGLLWIDGDGVPQVWSRSRLLAEGALTAVRTVTSRDEILDIAYSDVRSQQRNRVRVPYTGYSAQTWDTLWTLDELVAIAPGATWTTSITLEDIVGSRPYLYGTMTLGTSTALDPTAGNIAIVEGFRSRFEARLSWESAYTLTLNITNVQSSSEWIWLCDNTQNIDLCLFGNIVTTEETVNADVSDDVSIATFGENTLELTANPWIQTAEWAKGRAYALLAALSWDSYVITSLKIPGDPRIEPWDRLRIQDRHGIVLDGEYLVESDNDTFSQGALDQDLSLRPALPAWTLGESGTASNQAMMGEPQ